MDLSEVRLQRSHHSHLPDPCDSVEFITKEGKRYAWSDSNVQYEEVPPDGESFTLIRKRLDDLQTAAKALYEDQMGSIKEPCTWDERWEAVRRLL